MAFPREIVQIRITDEERISGILELAKLQQALIALHTDGIVIINNAIDTKHVDALNNAMTPDSYELEKDPDTHYNGPKETGNFTQYPPVYEPYLYQDIWSNQITARILENMLGPKPELRFLNTNVAMNGTDRQGIHADLDFDDHLDLPFAFTVNFYLVDCSPANGVTEWWLGTHHRGNRGIRKLAERLTPYILDEEIEKRRLICPPVRPTVPKGSIIIRDLRIWHAGVPNKTPVPRIMLGLIYFAKWYGNHQRTIFPQSARTTIKRIQGDLDMLTPADFIPDDTFVPRGVVFKLDYSGAGRGSQGGKEAGNY